MISFIWSFRGVIYVWVGKIKGEATQDLCAIHATVGVLSLDLKAIIPFIMIPMKRVLTVVS